MSYQSFKSWWFHNPPGESHHQNLQNLPTQDLLLKNRIGFWGLKIIGNFSVSFQSPHLNQSPNHRKYQCLGIAAQKLTVTCVCVCVRPVRLQLTKFEIGPHFLGSFFGKQPKKHHHHCGFLGGFGPGPKKKLQRDTMPLPKAAPPSVQVPGWPPAFQRTSPSARPDFFFGRTWRETSLSVLGKTGFLMCFFFF